LVVFDGARNHCCDVFLLVYPCSDSSLIVRRIFCSMMKCIGSQKNRPIAREASVGAVPFRTRAIRRLCPFPEGSNVKLQKPS
jgi:hypothetical protein